MAAARAATPLTLLNATEFPTARCMDGTPGGFYHAINASSEDWIFELQGGGECATRAGCTGKIFTPLGSSRYFKKSHKMGFLLEDTPSNPKLRTWNRVFLPYCSQDLWTGQRTDNPAGTWGHYFSGHLIIDAVLTHLERHAHLSAARRVILTGESAGS